MTYVHFDPAAPASDHDALEDIDAIRNNLLALRDAALMGGLAGWETEVVEGTGSEDQPQYIYLKNGSIWLRMTFTWGSSGGGAGNPTSIAHHKSENAGTDWDAVGTQSFTYSEGGYLTSSSWA